MSGNTLGKDQSMNVDELAARLAAYAAIENSATDQAQKESLARAADLVALYQSMAWVPEMDQHHPVGRRKFGSGPQHDPQSFSRFTRWLTQVRGVDLASRTQYQLKDAYEIMVLVAPGANETTINATERELRPFKKLIKEGYRDQVPELWAKAQTENRHPREVIRDFRAGWTSGQRRAATVTEKRSARRSAALSALERAWELDPDIAVEAMNLFMERHNLIEEEGNAPDRPTLEAV